MRGVKKKRRSYQMATLDPIDLAAEKSASERRTRALAVINRKPQSIVSQLSIFAFAFAILSLVFVTDLIRPSADFFPSVLLILFPSIAQIAASSIRNQRRLDALLELLGNDINKSW
jgi:hypothetical protein